MFVWVSVYVWVWRVSEDGVGVCDGSTEHSTHLVVHPPAWLKPVPLLITSSSAICTTLLARPPEGYCLQTRSSSLCNAGVLLEAEVKKCIRWSEQHGTNKVPWWVKKTALLLGNPAILKDIHHCIQTAIRGCKCSGNACRELTVSGEQTEWLGWQSMNVYKQSTRTERQMVTQSQDLFYAQ